MKNRKSWLAPPEVVPFLKVFVVPSTKMAALIVFGPSAAFLAGSAYLLWRSGRAGEVWWIQVSLLVLWCLLSGLAVWGIHRFWKKRARRPRSSDEVATKQHSFLDPPETVPPWNVALRFLLFPCIFAIVLTLSGLWNYSWLIPVWFAGFASCFVYAFCAYLWKRARLACVNES